MIPDNKVIGALVVALLVRSCVQFLVSSCTAPESDIMENHSDKKQSLLNCIY